MAGLYETDGHILIQKIIGNKTQNPILCITSLKNETLKSSYIY